MDFQSSPHCVINIGALEYPQHAQGTQYTARLHTIQESHGEISDTNDKVDPINQDDAHGQILQENQSDINHTADNNHCGQGSPDHQVDQSDHDDPGDQWECYDESHRDAYADVAMEHEDF